MKITSDEISGFSLGYGSYVSRRLSFWGLICALCVAGPMCGVLSAQSYLDSTGINGFASPYPAEMGTVDASSGNLHLEIPLGSFPQRGGSALVPKLTYDSHIWTVTTDGVSHVWTIQGSLYGLAFGTWGFDEGGITSINLMASANSGCDQDFMVWSNSGVQHYFNIPGTYNPSLGICSGASNYAADASGFYMIQSQWGTGLSAELNVYAPDGTEISGTSLYSSSIASEDSNGNYLGMTSPILPPGIDNPVIDTLGRKIVAPQFYSNPMTVQVMNSQGGTSDYVITTTTIPVSTDFGQSGIGECNNNCTAEVIQSIELPDGTSYSFLYDCDESSGNSVCNSDPGLPGYYGTLTSMTLPTGGTVTYGYVNFPDSSGNVSRWLNTKFNGTGGFWNYTPMVTSGSRRSRQLSRQVLDTQQVAVGKPDGSLDIISYTLGASLGDLRASYLGAWPTQILSYDTDGVTLLSTIQNTWNFTLHCQLLVCDHLGFQDVLKETTSTTLPVPGGSITKQTTYSYDSQETANITAVEEWKYQPGTSPTFNQTPDRGTYTQYATIGGNNNDINRPSSMTVCNNAQGSSTFCTGGGLPVAQTLITYDEYGSNGSLPLAPATGFTNHDDTDFGTSYTTRGNATQIYRAAGNISLTTAVSYDTTGQVISVLDPNNNATTYSYADVFYDDNGADPPAAHNGAPATNAYLTKVTDAIGSTSMGYYYWTGQPAVATDYDAVPTYSHYVDPFDRPTRTDYPIGWVLNQYHTPVQGETELDSYSAVADTTASASCVSCTHTQALLDLFGRPVTGNLVNNPAGEVSINNTFDGLNRVLSSTHPNFGPGDPNHVYEQTSFDGLGRALGILHADNEIAVSAYGAKVANFGGLATQQSSGQTYGYGYPVVAVDEAGKQRQEWIDGFGHVIEVDEPSASTSSPGTGTVAIAMNAETYSQTGSVEITVDGFVVTVPYTNNNYTAAQIASFLADGFDTVQSPVTASASGATVLITARAAAQGTDYSLSASVICTGGDCTAPNYSATPSGPTLTGGSGGLGAAPNVTVYTYDVLGNLTSVAQGQQNRSYQYDGLSRLTEETTPEAGTVTLSYLTSSGAVCSGNPSNPCSRTAPAPNQLGSATVTTTYTYNTANQLTQKTHSDMTGTEVYSYGTSPSSFNMGRLIQMTDPSGSEAYTYDKVGRVLQVAKVVGTTTYTTQYSYNTGSELTKVNYPSGRVVEYSYDDVGHLCLVAAGTTGCSDNSSTISPYLILPSNSYDAAGRPLSATYGNGVVATASYSPQTLELASLSYAKSATTLFGLNYYYQQNSTNCPTGNAIGNNGQIQCIIDVSSGTGDSGRSVAYTYDSLGRLLTANTAGSTQYPLWGLSWTYDRYGNATAQTLQAGSGYSWSFNVYPLNNQITTFTYDAAGNVMTEPTPLNANYTYDGEECNSSYSGSMSAATYICDGNHMRVVKAVTGTGAVTTVSIRSGGQVIAEYDNGAAVNAPTREYIYGNNLLAIVTGSTGGSGGTIIYQQRDHLSPRLYTDVNGNDVGEQGTYPFGESWYSNNTTSNWVFTSYERDQESGNDYALARSYANGQGRFLAPDPLEGVVGDPQSWNRYAYVENDPINLSDPSGQGFWSDLVGLFEDLFSVLSGGELNFGDDGTAPNGNPVCIGPGICNLPPLVFPPPSGQGTAQPNPGTGTGGGGGNGTGQGGGSSTAGGAAPQGGGGPGAGTTDPGNTGAGNAGPGGGGVAGADPSPSASGGGTISNPSGGGIWDECGSTCGAVLAGAANFSAGAGDALTFGLTKLARKGVSWVAGMGYGENVNYRSRAYWTGFGTGTAIGSAIGAYGAASAEGVNGANFGVGGRFNSVSSGIGRYVRFGWGWNNEQAVPGYVIRLSIGYKNVQLLGRTIWWHINF